MLLLNLVTRKHGTVTLNADLGLDFTPSEVAIWRDRWDNGPYRTQGDVSTYSPGDRAFILSSADSLIADSSTDIWTAPTFYVPGGSGSETEIITPYIPQWAVPEPGARGSKTLCAAFLGLILNDSDYKDAAKSAILTQFEDETLDFSNSTLWQPIFGDINPGFIIAEWALRLLKATEYIKYSFTSPQLNAIKEWHENIALFFQGDLDDDFESMYVDRYAENYTFNNSGDNTAKNVSSGKYTHDGGHEVKILHEYYNNRRLTIAHYLGFVGVWTDNTSLVTSCNQYIKELFRFGMFPGGYFADMYRGWDYTGQAHQEQGVGYVGSMLNCLVDQAFMQARNGDPWLFTYSTNQGLFGTAGASKSVEIALNLYFNLFNKSGGVTMQSEVLDGEYPSSSYYTHLDLNLARANIYYDNATWKQTYMRTHSGSNPYASSPSSAGSIPMQMGAGGASPGRALMYAQLEGLVDPY